MPIFPKGSMTATLAQLIPTGSGNAIPRATLATMLCMSDRHTRKAIADARADGLIVCNTQDGRGYYKPRGLDDIRRQYWQEKARMKKLYRATKPMRDALKAAGERV